jgi:hypothetical protein
VKRLQGIAAAIATIRPTNGPFLFKLDPGRRTITRLTVPGGLAAAAIPARRSSMSIGTSAVRIGSEKAGMTPARTGERHRR